MANQSCGAGGSSIPGCTGTACGSVLQSRPLRSCSEPEIELAVIDECESFYFFASQHKNSHVPVYTGVRVQEYGSNASCTPEKRYRFVLPRSTMRRCSAP